MTSKTDDEMAKHYRDKQAEIDRLVAELKKHEDIHWDSGPCQECRRLQAKLEQARYYGD